MAVGGRRRGLPKKAPNFGGPAAQRTSQLVLKPELRSRPPHGKVGVIIRRFCDLLARSAPAFGMAAEANWQEKLAALRAYVGAHGRLPPRRHPSGLGSWVSMQRRSKKATAEGRNGNLMPPQRVAALEAVPGWEWDARGPTWEERLAELEAHLRAHGWLPLAAHPSGLGKWADNQRAAKKAADAGRKIKNTMTPQRVAALEAVTGWLWDARRSPAKRPRE